VEERDREILKLFEAHRPRGLARAISRAESGRGAALMHELFPRSGSATTIGITGPPGVGKSTLSSALVKIARAAGKTVGVVSVDPSSPFSHGAILGDRIRLTEHFVDPDVFIRSMASRGHLGGLAGATGDAVTFMDAFGLDIVLIETVGVGQSEIEIAELADTTIVVLQPGSGDSVQLLKAGILEIADVFVVNKADHPMALQLKREIRGMMEMLSFKGWVPRLVSTEAHRSGGVAELWEAIEAHEAYLRTSGDLAERRRAAFAHRVRALVTGALDGRVDRRIEELMSAAGASTEDPYRTAAALLAPLEAVLPPGDGDHFARTPKPRASVRGL
jgi:LAO/AO transport system kinase